MNKKLITILSIVTLSLIFIVLFFVLSGGDAPNREVKVGRLHLSLSDDERMNWSGDGPRPLSATVWYPASSENSEQEWSAGVFRFGYSVLNAPFVDTRQRPLIVLSHGTGGSAAQLSWLAEHLVTGGYMVAAVNHHGNTAVEEKQWPAAFVLPSERSRDLTVLIDKLFEHPEIKVRIHKERIGAAGFSLGGYSVLGLVGAQLPSFDAWEQRCSSRPESNACQLPPEADFTLEDIDLMKSSDLSFQSGLVRAQESVQDHRISAVYVIAPALVSLMQETDLSDDVKAGIQVVLAEKDEQIALSETKHFLEQNLPHAKLKIIEKATHYVFLAPCNLRGTLFLGSLCSDPDGVNRRDIHGKIGQDAVEFFNSAL